MPNAPHPLHLGSRLVGGNRLEVPPSIESADPLPKRLLKRAVQWLRVEGINRVRQISQPTLTELLAACKDYREQTATPGSIGPTWIIRSPYHREDTFSATLLEPTTLAMRNGSVYIANVEPADHHASRTLPVIGGSFGSAEHAEWQEWTVWLQNGKPLLQLKGQGQDASGYRRDIAGAGMHVLNEHFGRQLRDVVTSHLRDPAPDIAPIEVAPDGWLN